MSQGIVVVTKELGAELWEANMVSESAQGNITLYQQAEGDWEGMEPHEIPRKTVAMYNRSDWLKVTPVEGEQFESLKAGIDAAAGQ